MSRLFHPGNTDVTESDMSGNTIAVNSYNSGSLPAITIVGDGNGSLTTSFNRGNPLSPAGVSTDSGSIFVNHAAADLTFLTTMTSVTFGSVEIRYPLRSALTLENTGSGSGIVAINGTVTVASADNSPMLLVNTGATVILASQNQFSSLDIMPGGTVRTVSGSVAYPLVINSLDISPSLVDAYSGGPEQGDIELQLQAGAGYVGSCYINNGDDSYDANVYLSPAGQAPYGLNEGRWTLVIVDTDPGNPWGGDTVAVAQGFNVVSGVFVSVGSTVAYDVTHPTETVTVSGTETLTNLYNSVAVSVPPGGGVLDLSGCDMIINSGDLSTIAGYLQTGYDGGKWDGEGSSPTDAAILSSEAADDTAQAHALGYAEVGSNTGVGQLNISTFDGLNVSSGNILVKYTVYGDADLDGTQDSDDVPMVNNGYNNHLSGWSNGDFTYAGSVGLNDFYLLYGTPQYPVGSLARALSDSVIKSIAGKEPSLTTQQIFSSLDTRNSSNFLANVDLTSHAEFATLPGAIYGNSDSYTSLNDIDINGNDIL